MTIVVDASIVVAGLVDSGPEGTWAQSILAGDMLAAPHLMPVEAAHALRRAALNKEITPDDASAAHEDMLQLELQLFSYIALAERIWQLRGSVPPYDAWYVALAEALGVRLATLDVKLSRASGPRCSFVTPDA